ncbi:MAG: DNA topoisomerase [Proteobacteria bacterium]|nr:DNA topoisomerase [Pseudomonadota bacterium]
MQLVIAEKPSVARDLARVLGVRPTGQHAFEGERCVITWCIGHLVELEEPATYDARWKAWRLEHLPMLPDVFRLRGSKHALPQLRAVVKLLGERRFREVINACDAGREGELIFRYVYQFAGARLPIRRLWVSSLTDDAIRRGFDGLRPGREFEPLADAARSRSEADWLVGMNATRAITARGRDAGHDALYSIGRVQTPTLAMLVNREHEIRAFWPRAYWEVHGTFTTAAGTFVAKWRDGAAGRVARAELAEAIAARDRAAGAVVETVRARTVREPPPMLFDLTSLQRTANRRFGWSAARTLELAQQLYERHKVLTYPRTDSRHLTTDVARELPALFEALVELPEVGAFAAALVAQPPRPGRRVVDDGKVRDHHAIIPTGTRPRTLDRDEARLFDLVARRFLGAFYPDAEFAATEAWIRVGPPTKTPGFVALDTERYVDALPAMPDRYLARGRVRVVAGWQEVAGIVDRDAPAQGREALDDAEGVLPPLVEGQAMTRAAYAPIAKQTTPPPRHTEATLLAAMESAGKQIDDEALRAAMRDAGLGTPATRASIIETLLRREYIERDARSIVPTATGMSLIAAIPIPSLASPELTGTWEARLARIARGEDSRGAFMADIAAYVTEIVGAIRVASPPSAPPPGGSPAPAWSKGKRGKGGKATKAKWRKGGGAASTEVPTMGTSAPTPTRRRDEAKPAARGARRAATAARSETATPRASRGVERAAPAARSQAPTPRGGSGGEWDAMLAESAERTVTRPAHAHVVRIDQRDHARGDALATAAMALSTGTGSREPMAAVPPRAPVVVVSPPVVTVPRTPVVVVPSRAPVATTLATRRPTAPPPVATGDALGCPRCRRGVLITGARGWGCSRWREGCGFVVWFETAGRKLTDAQLRDLVTRGKTRKGKFVADGSIVDGRLVLDPAATGGARLERAT